MRDRRSLDLALTPAGEAALAHDALPEFAAMPAAGTDAIGLADRLAEALGGVLAKRAGKPFGACKTCRHFRSDAKPGSHRCALWEEMLSAEDAELIGVEQA